MYREDVFNYVQNCSKESTTFLENEFSKIGYEYHEKKGKYHGNWKGGYDAWRKRADKKHRGFGFIPINKNFIGAEGHHIDINFVIYIPKELHRSIAHSVITGKNMSEINEAAFAYTYSEDIKPFNAPNINILETK